MKQITDLDELKGKVIEAVYESDNRMAIHFEGEEYILLKATGDGDYNEIEVGKYPLSISVYNAGNLLELHLITPEEHQELLDKDNKERQKRVHREEIAQLQKLKEKYPNA